MKNLFVKGLQRINVARGEHVLVVRSIADDVFLPLLDALRERGILVHALVQANLVNDYREHCYRIYELPEGHIEPDGIPACIAEVLRNTDFSCALVFCAMPTHRYENIMRALSAIHLDCRIQCITSTGDVELIDPVKRIHRYDFAGNRSRLLALKGLHAGKRAFLIGNGPSLQVNDLDRLKEEITFAANKIYLCFDQTHWRPNYYMVEDELVAFQNLQYIEAVRGVTKLLPSSFPEMLGHSFTNAIYYPLVWSKPRFSLDVCDVVYWGASVLFSMLQIAFYMGIREIYLIGLDFNYTVPLGSKVENEDIYVSGEERNHFHPSYGIPGEKWNIPNLQLQENAFVIARKTIEARGGHVYNASRETKLKVFDRVDFELLF